ncbi:gastrula zinc finger protein XlCGF52.1-like [Bradysia coprophila]|uniref:gastrula zinc finger protein XlCGF52.1-like n=1 Tax=Bradysia coprophila TaxID=38358 RepID=UPI00187D996B|nr:gastrula zinc finger protein XlCGF52.1-like [Bradysia coprophila]XP_037035020.1 gastrula zinc finger protein XlCGF52.1-like [Bradysia coprophila]
MVHVILKRECLDEDINIEYKPPPSIVDPIIVPTYQTTILTKNEIVDDLGMEIQIDGEMTMLRPCYVAVDKLSDRVLLSAKSKSKTSFSEGKNVSNGQTKINNSLKPFSCDFCPKTFARKDYLNTHRLMHTKEKIFQCDQCPKKFITQNYLNKHFRASHLKPFVCVECPMKFKTESLLKKHKQTHEPFWTKTKTYECYVCKEKRHFWKIGHLLNHMRSRHSSERPYHCEQCPKTFAVKAYLTAHKATHSLRENIHECNVCHKSYYRKVILASHMKSHYTDRPFKCEKCPKSFLHKSDLSRHIQTNSCKRITHLPKGSTFQCYICSKERKTFSMLRKHVLLVHLRNHSKIYSCDKCPKNRKAN